MEFDPLEVIKRAEKTDLQKIIVKLNEDGILLDDEDPSFSSSMLMKYWNSSCEKYLREKGYEGGSLLPIAKYFVGIGNLYALINTDKDGSHKIAISYLENLSKKYE